MLFLIIAILKGLTVLILSWLKFKGTAKRHPNLILFDKIMSFLVWGVALTTGIIFFLLEN